MPTLELGAISGKEATLCTLDFNQGSLHINFKLALVIVLLFPAL